MSSTKLHPSAVALRENVFAEALLATSSARRRRRAVDWIISLGIHVAVLGALLAVPLFFTQAIDFRQFAATVLVAPPVPLPPPPPPPVAAAPQVFHRPAKSFFETGKLVAPTIVPRVARPSSQDVPPPDVNVDGLTAGVPGGIPGGLPGGVLGGVLGGTGLPPALAAPAASAPRAPYRVGGTVKRPRLIYSIQPDYPLLARQAQVQGTVSIDAVIDEDGNVVEAHAISGSPLLIPAALQAVAKWKYEPSYLNGMPISVELTVDVIFRFH